MKLGKFNPIHKDYIFHSSDKGYTFSKSKKMLELSDYKKPFLKGRWKKYKKLANDESKVLTVPLELNNNNNKVLKNQTNTFRTIIPEFQSPKKKNHQEIIHFKKEKVQEI